MLYMVESPCYDLIKSSFRKRLYVSPSHIYLYLLWPFSYTFQWMITLQMYRHFTAELLFGSVRGQMRILRARTPTAALGNSVTFAVSLLCVQLNQTSGRTRLWGSELVLRTRLRRFSGRSGWESWACPGTRTTSLVLLLFRSTLWFVHLEMTINSSHLFFWLHSQEALLRVVCKLVWGSVMNVAIPNSLF